jgi:hypothetical protein
VSHQCPAVSCFIIIEDVLESPIFYSYWSFLLTQHILQNSSQSHPIVNEQWEPLKGGAGKAGEGNIMEGMNSGSKCTVHMYGITTIKSPHTVNVHANSKIK